MHYVNFTYVKNIEFDIEISIIYCNNFEYILFKKKKNNRYNALRFNSYSLSLALSIRSNKLFYSMFNHYILNNFIYL